MPSCCSSICSAWVRRSSFRSAPDTARPIRFAWSADVNGQGFGINPEWGGLKMFDTIRRRELDFGLSEHPRPERNAIFRIDFDDPAIDALVKKFGLLGADLFYDVESERHVSGFVAKDPIRSGRKAVEQPL